MTAPKHTPAPWRYIRRSDKEFSHPSIEALDDTFSVVILGFKDDPKDDGGVRGRTTGEAEANAHLIAAAPDLLAALQTLVEQAERHDAVGLYWDQARAAIAKAEGSAK
jgi:hypothetical protein